MTEAPINIAVSGAAGRMGALIIKAALAQPQHYRLRAALDRPDCPRLGEDAGTVAGARPAGIKITASLESAVDVLIDFSAPAGARLRLEQCVRGKIPLLIGTTGLTDADQRAIDQAAGTIAVLQTANTSLGINVLLHIAAQVARRLGTAYDVEIVEAHHNQKKDAPSGTALALAEAICRATDRAPEATIIYGRHGPDAGRQPGSIGIHAVRLADVVGEHSIYFAAAGERIELKHIATARETFARGALRAAEFLAGRKHGRYTMADVLGLAAGA